MTALADRVVLDVAVFEGGLLQRFLDRRRPLMPADEVALLPSWLRSRRSAYEVVGTRAGFGARLRDLVTEEVVQVDERLCTAGLQRGDVVLTRLLDGAEGPVLGTQLPVPLEQGDRLLAALREDSVAALLAWRRSSA